MKTVKRIFALALALMLVFSLALTANAAELEVEGALKGAEYKMYKMATIEKNETTGSILYYTTEEWKDFWNDEGATWFACDATTGLVTIKEGVTDSDMPAAAKKAKAYAAGKTVSATATAADTEDPTVKITADTGYYLMTSSKGSLCTITTIASGVTTISEKNKELPEIKKTVKDANVAIGDTVEFTLDITTGENHENEMDYVIHDTMSAGLDLVANSVEVLLNGVEFNGYTIETTCEDNCSFKIVFNNTLDTAEGDKITVTYKATVTKEIPATATNTAKIADSSSQVTLNTTGFTLNKVDGDGKALAGAEFELYYTTVTGEGETATTNYNIVNVIKDGNAYRPTVTGETAAEIEAGTATVKGLDPDKTYYVKETKAPTGYVKIEEYKPVVNGDVTVTNVKGENLPSTGGMGTTMFYTVGGLMVAAAVVLLAAKKRMSAV